MDHNPSRSKSCCRRSLVVGKLSRSALNRERPTTNDQRPFLPTDAAEVYVPRIRPDFQLRSATVKLTLSGHCFRPILPAFAGDANVGKVAADRVAIAHFDLCPDGDRQIVGQIYSDVAGRGFQRGIVVTASPSPSR